MNITIQVPTGLHLCCDGATELAVSAPTVQTALDALERDHPTLHRNFCDETGAVRRHLNLFVNSTHIRELNGLDTALAPGDVIYVIPAVSGG